MLKCMKPIKSASWPKVSRTSTRFQRLNGSFYHPEFAKALRSALSSPSSILFRAYDQLLSLVALAGVGLAAAALGQRKKLRGLGHCRGAA